MAGQILQAMGTPTGFKVQIGITSALAICCIPLVWHYMVRVHELARSARPPRARRLTCSACLSHISAYRRTRRLSLPSRQRSLTRLYNIYLRFRSAPVTENGPLQILQQISPACCLALLFPAHHPPSSPQSRLKHVVRVRFLSRGVIALRSGS